MRSSHSNDSSCSQPQLEQVQHGDRETTSRNGFQHAGPAGVLD
jgi:hypothetical protein